MGLFHGLRFPALWNYVYTIKGKGGGLLEVQLVLDFLKYSEGGKKVPRSP